MPAVELAVIDLSRAQPRALSANSASPPTRSKSASSATVSRSPGNCRSSSGVMTRPCSTSGSSRTRSGSSRSTVGSLGSTTGWPCSTACGSSRRDRAHILRSACGPCAARPSRVLRRRNLRGIWSPALAALPARWSRPGPGQAARVWPTPPMTIGSPAACLPASPGVFGLASADSAGVLRLAPAAPAGPAASGLAPAPRVPPGPLVAALGPRTRFRPPDWPAGASPPVPGAPWARAVAPGEPPAPCLAARPPGPAPPLLAAGSCRRRALAGRLGRPA